MSERGDVTAIFIVWCDNPFDYAGCHVQDTQTFETSLYTDEYASEPSGWGYLYEGVSPPYCCPACLKKAEDE